MRAKLQRLFAFRLPIWTYPLVLLALCMVSYSLFIRSLGYYWDDWPFIWISQKLGSEGLIRYFSTNRPIWGLIFQFTTPLLGHEPWHWHLFALLWRWIAAVVLWLMVRQVWPRYPTTCHVGQPFLRCIPRLSGAVDRIGIQPFLYCVERFLCVNPVFHPGYPPTEVLSAIHLACVSPIVGQSAQHGIFLPAGAPASGIVVGCAGRKQGKKEASISHEH